MSQFSVTIVETFPLVNVSSEKIRLREKLDIERVVGCFNKNLMEVVDATVILIN